MSAFPLHTEASAKIGGGRRWWTTLGRVWTAIGTDHISIMAAGTAYYLILALVPGMTALVLTYGLIADPVTIERHIGALSDVMPGEALKLISDQLHTLVSAPSEKLGIGLVISVLFALWSAASGTIGLMQALTVAYEGEESRGFLHFYGVAMGLTVGLVLFVVAALLLIAGVPAAAAELPMPEFWRQFLPLARWPMLALLAVLGLGTLYRVAPSRDRPKWDFLRAGTVAASLLWLGGSAGFSYYVAHFGSYDRTYGSLGAVAILLVWLYVSAYIVLVGAELNGELSRDGLAEPGQSK
ncbi:MAG TPA: YihY/virulence factor BrkB family protein [Stellaceae bacterium]|jgi:membrane protein|nr:YihY/virulence factor BrkB family protein [Stellaceae bacterium]